MIIPKRSVIVGATAALLMLTACQPQGGGMHVSRSETYGSLNAMLANTSELVVGTVEKQVVNGDHTARDDLLTTSAILSIQESLLPESAAQRWLERGVAAGTLSPGSTIVVQQPGTPEVFDESAPLLEVGETYLLFLNPANPEQPGDEFTVVGVSAGAYAQVEEGKFLWVPSLLSSKSDSHDEPVVDNLPEEIDIASTF